MLRLKRITYWGSSRQENVGMQAETPRHSQHVSVPDEYLSEIRHTLLRMVKRRVSNSDDAEDITQDVLVSTHDRGSRVGFDTLDDAQTWAQSLVAWRCKDYFRRAAKHRATSLDDLFEDEEALATPDAPLLAAMDREQLRLIQTALARISNHYYYTLYKFYFEECTLLEQAQNNKITYNAMKKLMQRAKAALRREYIELLQDEV